MKELKGTKTEKNLLEAFAGESMARNKYTYYASKAKKDGFEQIAAIFEETAQNEKEHAKLWFKYLEGGAIKETLKNLEDAANGGTTSGLTCMSVWQRKPKKKDSQKLQLSSVECLLLRSTTKSAIASS